MSEEDYARHQRALQAEQYFQYGSFGEPPPYHFQPVGGSPGVVAPASLRTSPIMTDIAAATLLFHPPPAAAAAAAATAAAAAAADAAGKKVVHFRRPVGTDMESFKQRALELAVTKNILVKPTSRKATEIGKILQAEFNTNVAASAKVVLTIIDEAMTGYEYNQSDDQSRTGNFAHGKDQAAEGDGLAAAQYNFFCGAADVMFDIERNIPRLTTFAQCQS